MKKAFSILFLAFCSLLCSAQSAFQKKEKRILFLLDASSSMGNKWRDTESKFDIAKKLVTTLLDSMYTVNKEMSSGLRVFGHQYPTVYENCRDTKLEVLFNRDNKVQIQLRLENIIPLGLSPIASALEIAGESDLTMLSKFDYSIILITDGGESCHGNICETVTGLQKEKIPFKSYVCYLGQDKKYDSQYKCFDSFFPISTENDFHVTVERIARLFSNVSSNTQPANAFNFGYLMIDQLNNRINNLKLYIKSGNDYVQFKKLNLQKLSIGQVLMLKSGEYKITYKQTPYPEKSKEFVIKNDTTKIQLL